MWRFHPNHGPSVKLSPDCTVAENIQDVFGTTSGLLAFTDAPVPLGTPFVIRGIDAPLYQPCLGLTTMCPDNMNEIPSTLLELHSSSCTDSWLWITSETFRNPDGDSEIMFIEGTNVNPREAHKLGVMVTPEGDVNLLADGKVIGIDWRGVQSDKPLWGVAEVHVTKVKLEIEAPRYPWEFITLNDVHTNALCDINLSLEKGTVIKTYVPENFKSMANVAKCGFHLWGETSSADGWVHSSNVRDITTENCREILDTAMEEGYFPATIYKLLLIGGPGVGKTGIKHLLFGVSPSDKRSSTAIATGAARAIVDYQDCSVVWKEVDANTLLDIFAQVVKHIRSGRPALSLTASLTSSMLGSLSTISSFTLQHESLYQSSIRNWFLAPKGLESPNWPNASNCVDRILEKMLFKENDTDFNSQKEWIYCIDSGSERCFLDILPAFVRGSTVYLLAVDLSENFNEKLQADYVREDTPIRASTPQHQTTLEMAESLASAFSSFSCNFLNATASPVKPKFFIVGTHIDKIKHKKRYKELLAEKNESLKRALREYLDICIPGGIDGQLIYPLDLQDREATASDLRRRIMEVDNNHVEVAIPSRWHAFEVELQRRAENVNRTVLTLAECTRIGATLKMDEMDVEDALVHLDQLNFFYYFPTVTPHIVFTAAQDLLDETTALLEVGLSDLALLPSNISRQIATKLRQEGLFSKQLAVLSCQKFRVAIGNESIYTVDDFLAIMKHLLIVYPFLINGEEFFFIPCILPIVVISQEEKRKFTRRMDPLLLSCDPKVVPHGMFPAIVIALLMRQTDTQFVLMGAQFRNAVTLRCTDLGGALLLIEHHMCLEVCYSGNPQNAPQLLASLHQSIADVCSHLSYDTQAVVFKEAFWCDFKGHPNDTHPCLAVTLPSGNLEVSCVTSPDLRKEISEPRKVAWIRSVATASVAEASDVDVTFAQHISCWLPDKWKTVGKGLGLEDYQLTAIGKKHKDNLECFNQVLYYWQKLPEARNVPQWPTLINVLRSPQVGEKALADSFENQFIRGVQNTSNSGIITGKLFLERVASVLPTKWKSIGLHLQLPKEIIEHIAKRHPGSPRHCYTDIFVLWRKIHSASRPVNWATLIDVLRTLGENELAQNLEDEFVKGVSGVAPDITGEGFLEYVASVIPNRWRVVGRGLGLNPMQLDAISHHVDGDTDSCYSEVFDTWQYQQQSLGKPFNWASLVAALKSPVVGEENLARRLEEQFVTSITKNDFLQQIATRIPEKWPSVGRALGVPNHLITSIDQQYHEEHDNCYAEVFAAWNKLPSTRKPVSWLTLITALRSPIVGESRLADTLHEVFVGIENYVFVSDLQEQQ